MSSYGLSTQHAEARLSKFGTNTLPETPPPSNFVIFISQLKDPLVYVLLAASGVTFFLGDYSDTVIIFIAIVINSFLGFFQESRANKAIFALKKLLHPEEKVIRDGIAVTLGVELVVPGDVVILDQGVKIPADGILIEANRFYVNEAILTGETKALNKKDKEEVFMGTVVTAGKGKMLVTKTGKNTKMGSIAIGIQKKDDDTPLKKQIRRFSKQLSVLVLGLTIFVFIVGFLGGRDLEETFTVSVALAVSAIPEGLLIGLTAVLAIGMQRITKRKGLVRRLVSAETLGGVTTICLDKTGTLTKGQMSVVETMGNQKRLATQAVLANDLDDPITLATWDWGMDKLRQLKKNADVLRKKYVQLDSLPFSSTSRFYASLNSHASYNCIYVNGAPEYLLQWSDLSADEKKQIAKTINQLTMSGKRVMGMARKKVSKQKESLVESDIKKDLTWVGLIAFSDPVRKSVKSSLVKAQDAGIKLVVITGDYADTAKHVLNELSLVVNEKDIVLGEELGSLSQVEIENLFSNWNGIKLFARTTPQQKEKLIDALKSKGEVVGMMGDGVNDALALKKADIGIVVAEASDVAKETADLILLDSNFNTIVAAIEEGRGIFDNIRKVVLYLMSDAFEEIVAVVGTIILGLPMPVTAAQILWINLVSDGLPNLALTVDPKAPGIMKQKPRSKDEQVVTGWVRELIAMVSFFGGISALIVFYLFYKNTADVVLARSVAFATLGVNSLVYVFSVRTLKEPFWHENPFANKWLNLAVVAGLFLQFLPFVFSPLRSFFEVSALNFLSVGAIFLVSALMFLSIEIFKHLLKVYARR